MPYLNKSLPIQSLGYSEFLRYGVNTVKSTNLQSTFPCLYVGIHNVSAPWERSLGLFPVNSYSPRQTAFWLPSVWIAFAYFWTLCSWNCTLWTLLSLASFIQHIFVLSMLLSVLYFVLSYCSVVLYHMNKHNSVIHSPIDGHWNSFQFWL